MNKRQRTHCGTYKDEPHSGEFKVLIFDENPKDLLRHAEPFEARGFDVCKCMSVETALRCIEREDFDFAVVDQGSKSFESLHALQHLVRYNPRTPFVVVTEYHDPRCRDEALALGATDYLRKPLSSMKLNSIVQKVFGSSSGEFRDIAAGELLNRKERTT